MDEANERKMAKTFNMIVMGGLLKIRPIVTIESVITPSSFDSDE